MIVGYKSEWKSHSTVVMTTMPQQTYHIFIIKANIFTVRFSSGRVTVLHKELECVEEGARY